VKDNDEMKKIKYSSIITILVKQSVFCFLIITAIFLNGVLYADIITLGDATTITGKISAKDTEKITVKDKLTGNVIIIRRRDIKSIVYEKDEHQFHLSLSASFLVPVGKLSDLYTTGYGTNIDFSITDYFIDNLNFRFSTGIYAFHSNISDTYSITSMPVYIMTGYSVQIMDKWLKGDDSVTFMPWLGFGYMMHILYVPDSSKYFFNPAMSIVLEFVYKYNDVINFFIAPGYSAFFEEKNTGQFFNLSLGAMVKF
jgi:hypothetical protein